MSASQNNKRSPESGCSDAPCVASGVSTPLLQQIAHAIGHALPRFQAVSTWFVSARGLEFRAAWDLHIDGRSKMMTSPLVNVIVTNEVLDILNTADHAHRRLGCGRIEAAIESRLRVLSASAVTTEVLTLQEWIIDKSSVS